MPAVAAGYGDHVVDAHEEREQKFEVPLDFTMPDVGAARVRTLDLRATYYDTAEGLLQAHDVTLRRRLGGDDEGWHLKLPTSEGRLELQADAASTRTPQQFSVLTRGLRYDQPLRRRTFLRTVREAHQVLTGAGDLVAELSDDRVQAVVTATREEVRWREVEIELGPAAEPSTADRYAALVRSAGATPARDASKLAHAVGRPAPPAELPRLAGLVDAYLQTQYSRLAVGDFRLRRQDDAVHKTRVAVRRLRSTLRTFAPLFEDERRRWFDDELSWYADVLGRVRDLDVLHARLEPELQLDPESTPPATADRVLQEIAEQREAAWNALQLTLESRRYRALLAELYRWRVDAPWTDHANASARQVERYVRRSAKKSDKRLHRARAQQRKGSGDGEIDRALHRARKAARRTRYAAELSRPVLKKRAKHLAADHRHRQDELGEVQDHAMVVDALHALGLGDQQTSAFGFVCGLLAQRHVIARDEARRSPR